MKSERAIRKEIGRLEKAMAKNPSPHLETQWRTLQWVLSWRRKSQDS